MNALSVIRALGPIDGKSIARDPMLRWFVLMPVGFALAARWLLPLAIERVSVLVDHDLAPYYRPLTSLYFLQFAPSLAGWVVGFLLLDQRDDGTLAALRVTPLTLNGFLLYRLALPMLSTVASSHTASST